MILNIFNIFSRFSKQVFLLFGFGEGLRGGGVEFLKNHHLFENVFLLLNDKHRSSTMKHAKMLTKNEMNANSNRKAKKEINQTSTIFDAKRNPSPHTRTQQTQTKSVYYKIFRYLFPSNYYHYHYLDRYYRRFKGKGKRQCSRDGTNGIRQFAEEEKKETKQISGSNQESLN